MHVSTSSTTGRAIDIIPRPAMPCLCVVAAIPYLLFLISQLSSCRFHTKLQTTPIVNSN